MIKRYNLQFFGGRGSGGGNTFIISHNEEGQELRIPRSTYERRLKEAEEYKQGLLDMASDSRNAYRNNPKDLRRADERIERLRKILKSGRDE